jgi:hypothetical protein
MNMLAHRSRFCLSSFKHHVALASKPFTCTVVQGNNLPPRPKPPPDDEIEESFLKGSGPGGQKIVMPHILLVTSAYTFNVTRTLIESSDTIAMQNKTNSAVQLKHVPTGIVVKSQATRSRSQNRKHARELLAQKVDDLRHGEQSRSSIVGQVKQKKAASAAKKSRRKYRKLEEDKEAGGKDGDESLQPSHEPGCGADDVQDTPLIEKPNKCQQKIEQP